MVHKFSQKRLSITLVSFSVAFAILGLRALFIQVFPPAQKNLQNLAAGQYRRSVTLSPYRGSIFDRRGNALAISIRKPSLSINPKVFDPTATQRRQLSRWLSVPSEKIDKISRKKSYFAWLKRRIDPSTANKILLEKIPGLHRIWEPSRSYPAGSLAANVLGLVGTDQNGLFGLERIYEKRLQGQQSKVLIDRDGRGLPIFVDPNQSDLSQKKLSGTSLVLTLDAAIQGIAEKELKKGVQDAAATSGHVIVADPHSGRILAMANYPTFDPNSTRWLELQSTRNLAMHGLYEPGSVVKPFVVAAAIDQGHIKPSTRFYCEKGSLKVGRRVIRDTHPQEYLTVAEIIAESSNICLYKIAQRLDQLGLAQAYRTFGIGQGLGEIPTASKGRVTSPTKKPWRPIRFANISFGQGFLTTALEVVRAFGAIANGGHLMDLFLLEKEVSATGEILHYHHPKSLGQIIRPDTAQAIRKMLVMAVEQGTGKNAATESYQVGGKTGTAEKVDPKSHRYSKHLRLATFAGIAPIGDPHIVVYVGIDEPSRKPYYGGTWAAPVFAKVVQGTLRYLNVPRDKTIARAKPLTHREG